MSAATPLDFERIIEVLNRRRVRYVVIGGVAAILQGADLPRTLDIDITPAASDSNKRRLARALRDLDARLRVPGLDEGIDIKLDLKTFANIVTMMFTTRYGPLDISFIPDGTTGYDDLARDAVTVHASGLSVPVTSIRDIVRSKRAAGREKDAAHIRVLSEFLDQQR